MEKMKKILMMCVVIGSAAVSQAVLVDDFQTYSTGLVSGGASGGVWTPLLGITAPPNADTGTIQNESGNLLLTLGSTTAGSGVYRALPSAIPGSTAATTLFMRTRANDTGVNASIGLSDVAAPTDANNFAVFEPQMRMINTSGANLRFNVRNGGAFTDLTTPTAITVGQWYNVWMVVNTVADTWNIYINTGTADATVADLKMSGIGFRDTTDSNTALSTILVYTGATAIGGSMAASVDDFFSSDGLNLANPIPEPATMTMMVLGLGSLFLRKRK
jgi:PEP-CTERM motif